MAGSCESGGASSRTAGFPHLVFCILTRGGALMQPIRGGGRMRETRPCGFVGRTPGDWHPYRSGQILGCEIHFALKKMGLHIEPARDP